ncbi:MAG: cupredoxin domain-containing protein [Candidatus Rokubacteria bacterium]|nr:cupredoxin domain-containing protein [Candidatus Rokubacteria bacterium]
MKNALACLATALVVLVAGASAAQDRLTHTVFISLVEVKGGTTADKLAPPGVNPKEVSKGYEFKPPGAADKNNPQRWEVSSYMFSPGHVTVRQGDEIALTAFVVNGDVHEVWVTAPDGTDVVPKTKWSRGREYQVRFRADKAGAYKLVCSDHAPSMTATFLAMPR